MGLQIPDVPEAVFSYLKGFWDGFHLRRLETITVA